MPQFESHFFSSLIFWEILSFGILFFLLYKYAFPSLLGMLEEREDVYKRQRQYNSNASTSGCGRTTTSGCGGPLRNAW